MEILNKTDIYLIANIFRQKLEMLERQGKCRPKIILGFFDNPEAYLKYLNIKRLKRKG